VIYRSKDTFMLFRLNILFFLFLISSLSAQDVGPVKVDLDGYVDDRKGEIHTVGATEEVIVVPKETVKKPEGPKETNRRQPRNSNNSTSRTTNNRASNKNISKVALPTGSHKESQLMTYIMIGGGVVGAIVIVVIVVVIQKKNKVRLIHSDEDTISLADKIEANEVFEAGKDKTQIQLPHEVAHQSEFEPASVPDRKTQYDMADKFASDTKVDERGRNPSGIIIDEDKYFGGASSSSFVDEDMAP
jgi:hypothetical protein